MTNTNNSQTTINDSICRNKEVYVEKKYSQLTISMTTIIATQKQQINLKFFSLVKCMEEGTDHQILKGIWHDTDELKWKEHIPALLFVCFPNVHLPAKYKTS